jgi:ubiquinol-cytochrome c reductase iron-sulfur subunit
MVLVGICDVSHSLNPRRPTTTTTTTTSPFIPGAGANKNYKRLPPGGDVQARAFQYFIMNSGRFIYASVARLAVLKLLMTWSAAKDVLALASLEVDLSTIALGSTVTVKWRGKPVFIKHRTPKEIEGAAAVPMTELKHPETDAIRAANPEWLVVLGVCTHLGCVPISNAGDYMGWFCPCHGSHYDSSGRIRKGPAPLNLEVPEYKFLTDETLLIG